MEIILLIVLILAETALAVISLTKFREKASRMKNRWIVTVCEAAAVIGIILLPTVYMKWRFICAVAVLFIRLLIELIVWLVRRKKAVGEKKKVFVILNWLLSVIIISFSMLPAFIFTNYNGLETTGEFNVKAVSAILVDKSRKDTFENDGSYREVPAHFYYPETDSGSYPLIVFSHGAFGYYQSNFSTYEELVSHGYVVVSLDHPHHAFFTEDTKGNTIIVDSKFMNDAMNVGSENVSIEEIYNVTKDWMKLRTDDENFVLDTIEQAKESLALSDAWHADDQTEVIKVLSMTDTDKIGLMGHSLGGATSVNVGRQRDDIDTVVVLDGTMFGEIIGVENGKYVYEKEAYPVPVLDFTKEKDYNDREQFKKDNGYAYINEYVIENAKDGKVSVFANAGHMDFTDLPLISPVLASMLGKGEVDSEEFVTQMNGIILNWFDYYLKNEGTLDIQAKY